MLTTACPRMAAAQTDNLPLIRNNVRVQWPKHFHITSGKFLSEWHCMATVDLIKKAASLQLLEILYTATIGRFI